MRVVEARALSDIVDHRDVVIERLSEPLDDEKDSDAPNPLSKMKPRPSTNSLMQSLTCGFDLKKTPQLQWELTAAAAEAYGRAVKSFSKQFVGTEVAEEFELATDIELQIAITGLKDQFLVETVSVELRSTIKKRGPV
ncbi:hypothetical protein [Halocatena pleomorpha]|uniref:Uncharacterized protein n=1 Tax=Halocatena pleomorpha TaxID=1785090 RepID=A0A3P3R6H0_9EURY|nr:hypothetical protein [Halocatena pleomorpha]RRJ28499.1 hypothetical protein EIK79_15500 [Halocatena pleomorpha]